MIIMQIMIIRRQWMIGDHTASEGSQVPLLPERELTLTGYGFKRAQFWPQSWKMLQERARGGGGLLEGGEPAPGDWLSHLRQNWPGVLVLAYQVIDYGSGEVISSIEPERQTSYLSCVQVDDYSLILFTWNSEMFSHSIWVETISCAEALIRAFSGFRLKSSQDRYLQC